jgi:hypothetical protein
MHRVNNLLKYETLKPAAHAKSLRLSFAAKLASIRARARRM